VCGGNVVVFGGIASVNPCTIDLRWRFVPQRHPGTLFRPDGKGRCDMIDLTATAALIQNLKNNGFTSAREKLIALVLANVSQIQQCEIIEILDLSDPHCRSTLKEFVEKKTTRILRKTGHFLTSHRIAGTSHRDGTTSHRNGTTSHRDGTTSHRDGTTSHRDGTTSRRDGTTYSQSRRFAC